MLVVNLRLHDKRNTMQNNPYFNCFCDALTKRYHENVAFNSIPVETGRRPQGAAHFDERS